MGDRRCDERGGEQSRQQLPWRGADGARWSDYGCRAPSPSAPLAAFAGAFSLLHISALQQEGSVCELDTVRLIRLGITQSLGDPITREMHGNAHVHGHR